MMTKENRIRIKEARAELIDRHYIQASTGGRPSNTVTDVVRILGYETAREVIAAMINAKGAWDGRISDRARAWAADYAPSRDELTEAGIYYCDDIHPAHMEMIACAMMKYQPEPETTAAEEAPAEEPAPQNYKVYQDMTTLAITLHAATAMAWHRGGATLSVVTRSGQNDEVIRRVMVKGASQKTERSPEDENRAHCKRIAMELDAYVNGDVRRCPDCGEEIQRDWDEVGEAFKCPHCGEVASVDDWEELGAYDFLSDALDVDYIVSGRARDSLRAVRVMVAYGGPTIYIDTDTGYVELYWWTERARYALSSYAIDAVNEWAEELWACM